MDFAHDRCMSSFTTMTLNFVYIIPFLGCENDFNKISLINTSNPAVHFGLHNMVALKAILNQDKIGPEHNHDTVQYRFVPTCVRDSDMAIN